jgi:hypothetical protein
MRVVSVLHHPVWLLPRHRSVCCTGVSGLALFFASDAFLAQALVAEELLEHNDDDTRSPQPPKRSRLALVVRCSAGLVGGVVHNTGVWCDSHLCLLCSAAAYSVH